MEPVDLPVLPPLDPMLAKAAARVPDDPDTWSYEPKWDGFRCIVVREGDSVELTSRNERPFTRYFPELLGPLRDQLPDGCIIDGEIVPPSSIGSPLQVTIFAARKVCRSIFSRRSVLGSAGSACSRSIWV